MSSFCQVRRRSRPTTVTLSRLFSDSAQLWVEQRNSSRLESVDRLRSSHLDSPLTHHRYSAATQPDHEWAAGVPAHTTYGIRRMTSPQRGKSRRSMRPLVWTDLTTIDR